MPTKTYNLKVTVTSDLLPDTQGIIRANISTALFAAFAQWKATGVSVEEVPDLEKEVDEQIQKIAAREKDFSPSYNNHFNDGADWAFKKVKALITK